MSSTFVTPGQYRNLRACMVCSIVQPHSKFTKEGCPNCEEAIHLRNNPDKVEDCTSPVFEGLIALWQPTSSWVSKWQRIDGFVKGMYAVKVSGNLPEEIILQLEDADVYYQPRDGSDSYNRE
ncbi:putative transcriptional elongation protein Spt4 [Tirmania nivea]|nr:putative transcriptional elongation protein Spt4 [Tirmania nivea]